MKEDFPRPLQGKQVWNKACKVPTETDWDENHRKVGYGWSFLGTEIRVVRVSFNLKVWAVSGLTTNCCYLKKKRSPSESPADAEPWKLLCRNSFSTYPSLMSLLNVSQKLWRIVERIHTWNAFTAMVLTVSQLRTHNWASDSLTPADGLPQSDSHEEFSWNLC